MDRHHGPCLAPNPELRRAATRKMCCPLLRLGANSVVAPTSSPSHSHESRCLKCNRETARPWLPRPASTLGPALWALPDPVAHVASNWRTHLGWGNVLQVSVHSTFSPLTGEPVNHPAHIPSASSAWPAPRAVAPLSPCISCPFCARLAAPSQPCPCTSTTSNCYTRKQLSESP